MSVMEWRGGIPVIFRGTVTTAGVITGDAGEAIPAGTPIVVGKTLEKTQGAGRQGRITPKWIEIRNLNMVAGNGLLIYFTQKQFDDDEHALVIPGAASQLSVWSVPAEIGPRADGADGIWLRSQAGTPEFCITAIARRSPHCWRSTSTCSQARRLMKRRFIISKPH